MADKKTRKGIQTDEEIKKILSEVNNQSAEQLSVLKEIDREQFIKDVRAIQDPKLSHKLYYGMIQKLLRKYLPKGEENKKLRKLVRNEINLFLNEGETKGRDGRQTFTHLMNDASQMIIDWFQETNGQDFFNLYNKFHSKNIKRA